MAEQFSKEVTDKLKRWANLVEKTRKATKELKATVKKPKWQFPDIAYETPDMVNNPPHYQLVVDGNNLEVTKLIQEVLTEEEYIGYLKGNCIKYQLRPGKESISEDWKKSAFYNNILKELI